MFKSAYGRPVRRHPDFHCSTRFLVLSVPKASLFLLSQSCETGNARVSYLLTLPPYHLTVLTGSIFKSSRFLHFLFAN